ncbi:MAG: mechanosensitive ion channel [Paludibacteraceae bacterium]|nr:mechanosensitive ion channel [Paludibacteraceae bacterium]
MNLLSIFLQQVPALTPEEIEQRRDSVIQGAQQMIEYAKTDPHGFWQRVGETMLQFGLKVLAALLLYIVGMWLISLLKRGLKRVFDRRDVEPTLASFITSFVSISLTVLLVIVSVSTLGVNTTSLAALLAAGGMAIGMALSGTVQNIAGGLMILAFKPFKAGDYIEAQGYGGTVVEVNITATKILTVDNRVVILPNGALSNGTVNNYSGRPLRRVEWEVSVSYGVDAAACKQAILNIINSDERVLQADTDMDELYKQLNISKFQLSTINYRMDAIPAPFVALKALNANDITFVARAWVKGADYWGVFFTMQERFYTELPPQGFTFAYPHVDVTMLSDAAAQ